MLGSPTWFPQVECFPGEALVGFKGAAGSSPVFSGQFKEPKFTPGQLWLLGAEGDAVMFVAASGQSAARTLRGRTRRLFEDRTRRSSRGSSASGGA